MENTTEQNMNGTTGPKKVSHVYDPKTMTVQAWGNTFKYSRFEKEIKEFLELYPNTEEVFTFALKGFIDDLQDCTTSIKKSDYKKTPEGEDAYRQDCLVKRRELEGHINAGTRPVRVNAVADPDAVALKAKAKELKSTFDYQQLAAMKLLGLPMTAEQKDKLAEFEEIAKNA